MLCSRKTTKRYDGTLLNRFMSSLEDNGVRGSDYLTIVLTLRQIWSSIEQISSAVSLLMLQKTVCMIFSERG